ncbi:MAG: response regulator transcription factor [Bacteroidetes bacterium]|nr:MAG: response regulator transcription factor [Bacteroidota bacterium]
MIRAIIIDDEPLAIDALEIILKRKCGNDVQVIATSNSPKLGKSLIEEYHPDLIFLDIEMPGMSGIDLVQSFSNPTFRVVFITAFDAYAIEALRLSAMDYLLKPVETDDIINVVAKIKSEIRKNENLLGTQIQNLEKLLTQTGVASESRIGIAMADKIVFINISDILYCEAKGVYTNIYLYNGKKILASKPLGDFESQLSIHKFFRIHHSTLINLNHIKEFQRFNGGYVVMQNNEKLEVSHRKRKDFLDAINDLVV